MLVWKQKRVRWRMRPAYSSSREGGCDRVVEEELQDRWLDLVWSVCRSFMK